MDPDTQQMEAIPPDNPPQEVFDVYIDKQFISSDCKDKEDYAREPWSYSRDKRGTYLSIRYSKREEFLGKLEDHDKIVVNNEIERIQTTADKFFIWDAKKPLQGMLRDQRNGWRNAVRHEMEKLKKEVSEDEKDIPRKERYIRTLQLLKEQWDHGESNQPEPKSPKWLRRLGIPIRQPPDDERAPDQDLNMEEENVRSQKSNEVDEFHGFKAGVMYFAQDGSKLSGRDRPGCIGTFPNQKMLVSNILKSDEGNILAEKCPPNCFRYFHFPSNNMTWIEQAIARYYNEKPIGLEDGTRLSKGNKTNTEKLLAREFWRGQMHGTGGRKQSNHHQSKGKQTSPPIHARHMRPKCSIIPRGPDRPNGTSRRERKTTEHNIALFLPYLHWETSSRRAKMVSAINGDNVSLKQSQREVNHLPDIVSAVVHNQKADKVVKRPMRKTKSRSCLARYLMTVASVAEDLDYEADERLLCGNIHRDPPLHVRRTLDQYYFLTLDDTSARDKDQVVYRSTKSSRNSRAYNTRVVMVDQLWLWIIDDNTIITSFPRRWGRNKPDPSGVHKSLRERLQNGAEDITSLHHLALIIIDQCSRVFFDRIKPLDQRPEVMDLFASAIGNVTDLTAIAHESFWRNVALVSKDLIPNDKGIVRRRRLLDINPEGKLLQETQDIIEELRIMRQVFQEQIHVVKDFKRYLEPPSRQETQGIIEELRIMRRVFQEQTHVAKNSKRSLEPPSHERNSEQDTNQVEHKMNDPYNDAAHEAQVVLELIESRQSEIQDLEDSALRTYEQLKNLLSLKQQQTSIVEAKASLERADESIKQGRAIMAFTVVTIFFLPLSFFATFFGMNNSDINDAMWMTLNQQITWMFGLSTIVIALTISIAFSKWMRSIAKLVLHVPYAFFTEYTGIHAWWSSMPLYSEILEQRGNRMLEQVSRRRANRERISRDDTESYENSASPKSNVNEESCMVAEGQQTQTEVIKPRSSTWETLFRRGNHTNTSDGGESGGSGGL
ncbi:hypothetical protein F5B20DRAFT_580109 [Whalleya microplaca]|nr:hypothetical protein F5B20DRAFT_580109 [Whalleya microplaca]